MLKFIIQLVRGDRFEHIGDKGEWGHGISILSSQNILITNYLIQDCWGDGLYIGRLKELPVSDKVYLYNGILDNNRRNGISITSVKHIVIDTLFSSNTNGTNPMSGLVIEPNNNNDLIENIKVKNLTTYNNKSGGVVVNINKLGNGEKEKQVDILISNFKDYFSKTGILISNVTINPEIFSGIIELENLELYYNKTPFSIKSSEAENLLIKVKEIDWKFQKRKAFTKEVALKELRDRKDILFVE